MTDAADDINALIDDFALLDNWEQRYRHVIELGAGLPAFPAAARDDAHRVRGCVSQVWLLAEPEPGPPPRITYYADSDAHIVRGLAAILMRMYSGRTAEEILSIDPEATFAKLELDEHLSPQRSNGLRAMVDRIRELAAQSRDVRSEGSP